MRSTPTTARACCAPPMAASPGASSRNPTTFLSTASRISISSASPSPVLPGAPKPPISSSRRSPNPPRPRMSPPTWPKLPGRNNSASWGSTTPLTPDRPGIWLPSPTAPARSSRPRRFLSAEAATQQRPSSGTPSANASMPPCAFTATTNPPTASPGPGSPTSPASA